jgi:protein O-GlcNAc transferase
MEKVGGDKRVKRTAQETLAQAVQRHQAGQPAEAEKLYREVLQEWRDHPQTLHLLGVVLAAQNKYDAAVEAYRRAVALKPDMGQAHGNLGIALHAQGKLDEALVSYRRALEMKPDWQQVQNNLGTVLMARGRMAEAIAAYRKAVALVPTDATAHRNLGRALRQVEQLDEAIAETRAALALEPNRADDFNTLGSCFHAKRQFDEAGAAYRQALALEPTRADAMNNLADILKHTGRVAEAIEWYRRVIEIDTSLADVFSNLLYALHFDPSYDGQAILREHRVWDRRYARPPGSPHTNDRTADRKLRIGYVSPDLRGHVVGWNLLPLLGAHDRERFHITCYASVAAPDATTRELQGRCDVWRNIYAMGDDRAAEMIRSDGIDILVDLSLHIANNRLLIFLRKPSPVQVTYLGYCSTTGLSTMDYRLSDPHLDPPGSDLSCYSEETVRLPVSYWCYQPGGPTPEVAAAPSIANGYMTFGCMNNFSKVSDEALRVWARVLEATAGSRLMIHCPKGSHMEAARQRVVSLGIPAERQEWVGFQSWAEYIQTYHRIDVALDPFPYGGGITTCDALWMGVPVVSLCGRTAVGRGGKSILTNLGLPQLAVDSPEEYVRLAADAAKWTAIRPFLRQRMSESPLMDAKRFARDVESAYMEMWRKWAAGS